MSDSTITVKIPGHGTYSTTSFGLERAIEVLLPGSTASVRQFCTDQGGVDFSDVHGMGALLVIAADISGW